MVGISVCDGFSSAKDQTVVGIPSFFSRPTEYKKSRFTLIIPPVVKIPFLSTSALTLTEKDIRTDQETYSTSPDQGEKRKAISGGFVPVVSIRWKLNETGAAFYGRGFAIAVSGAHLS